MKRRRFVRTLGLVVSIVVAVSSCATDPETTHEEVVETTTVPETDRPVPEVDQVEGDPESEDTDSAEPTTTIPDADETPFSQEEVTEELYDQTFDEVGETIAELNQIIANEDFARWQTYLTDDYRRTYSDPNVLAESSQSAVLRRNNIRLETLEDYFRFVVVPSRANVRLDDILFTDESTVEAIMEVEGERYLLYNLTKSGDRWKIDTF
jgi:hypothetical protein